MDIRSIARFALAAVAVAIASAAANGEVGANTEWWSVPPRTTIGEVVAAVPDSAVAEAATNYAKAASFSVATSATNYTDGAIQTAVRTNALAGAVFDMSANNALYLAVSNIVERMGGRVVNIPSSAQ